MSAHDLEANKLLARRFVEALNQHDLAAMDALLHPEFIWSTAVVADDAPNEFRPMKSKLLQGRQLPHAKPRLDREEAMTVFATMFAGNYGDSMKAAARVGPAVPTAPVQNEQRQMRMDIHGLTAEEDRVAMEAESHVANSQNGRVYNNFYHYLFRIRDGKLSLFKEYQDTLHLFDYVSP
jgi:ketosteroid isomerase-like protein